jgi:hypothetical protein
VNPAVINTPKAVKIPICSSDRQSVGLNLVVHQHHARLRRTTGPDLMTPPPPPCAPSSRRHQVAPMVLNSHLAITKLDLIDGFGKRRIHHRGSSGDVVDSPRQIHHRGSGGDVIDRVWEGRRWVQVYLFIYFLILIIL